MLEFTVRKERSSWRLPDDRHWRALLRKARRHIRFPKHVVVAIGIVGDRTMKRLNSAYRGKQKTTDVLSFNYTPITKLADARVVTGQVKTKIQTNRLEGDIIICFPQARRQARAIGNTINEELSFLFVHGLLHLLGYDHEKSRKEERRMFALQDKILGRA